MSRDMGCRRDVRTRKGDREGGIEGEEGRREGGMV